MALSSPDSSTTTNSKSPLVNSLPKNTLYYKCEQPWLLLLAFESLISYFLASIFSKLKVGNDLHVRVLRAPALWVESSGRAAPERVGPPPSGREQRCPAARSGAAVPLCRPLGPIRCSAARRHSAELLQPHLMWCIHEAVILFINSNMTQYVLCIQVQRFKTEL